MDFLGQSIPPFFERYIGKPDARVSRWALLNSPAYLVGIVTGYFLTLLTLNRLMKNRKPFDLRLVIIVYNALQTCFSAYICKEVFMSAYLADYSLSCTPVGKGSDELVDRMANTFWYFYLSKVFDLCNTVFFVLRKRQRQLSFLHLYHHSTMIFNWYIGSLYSPGGQAFFSVFCNALVHVIMYLYYLLSAMGPQMQKYLWWKRYLTQIQLIQFFVVILHLIVGMYNRCKAPFWLNCFTIGYLLTMVALFANFYKVAYKSKRGTLKRKRRKSRSYDFKAGGDFKYD